MDMDDEEFERQHALDRSRSDNPVLNAWLTEQQAAFPSWAERHVGDWDFGPSSLDRLESLVRGAFGSHEEARSRQRDTFLSVAAWYLGETHNRHAGTVWQLHPDPPEHLRPQLHPFVIIPWERLDEYEDPEGIEDDARPMYTPTDALCQLFTWGPDRHLRAELDRYEPTR